MSKPSARYWPAMAYSPTAKASFVIGGIDIDGICDDMWRWRNGEWSGPLTLTDPRPVARQQGQAVFSPHDNAILYFGGIRPQVFIGDLGATGDELMTDLWAWDGEWRELATNSADRPPGRYGRSIAYDSKRNRLVVFGGELVNGPIRGDQDTWEFDGASWKRFPPPSANDAPSLRKNAAMCFDSTREKIVLVGGDLLNFTPGADGTSDTWERDGTGWEQKTPTLRPDCFNGNLVYDPDRQRSVLFNSGTTWEWDGIDWIQCEHQALLPHACGATYDTDRKRIVTFGGTERWLSNVKRPMEMCERVDGVWIAPATLTESSPRNIQRLVENSTKDVVVALGWEDDGTALPPTAVWEFDGVSWSPPQPMPEPFSAARPGLAYDAKRDEVLLAGGEDFLIPTQPTIVDGLWRRADNGWSQPEILSGPGPRAHHMLEYINHLQQVVLCGGYTKDATHKRILMRDTWLWNGATWTKLDIPGPDLLFERTVAAYDVSRKRLVAFDGQGTWEFDGTQWEHRAKVSSNFELQQCSLAYDPVRKRSVLIGSKIFTGPRPDPHAMRRQPPPIPRQTWEWNGDAWEMKRDDVFPDPFSTPDLGRCDLAFAKSRGRIVCFGRGRRGWAVEENWEWDGSIWTRF